MRSWEQCTTRSTLWRRFSTTNEAWAETMGPVKRSSLPSLVSALLRRASVRRDSFQRFPASSLAPYTRILRSNVMTPPESTWIERLQMLMPHSEKFGPPSEPERARKPQGRGEAPSGSARGAGRGWPPPFKKTFLFLKETCQVSPQADANCTIFAKRSTARVYRTRLRPEGWMRSSSRYLATVRLANRMPSLFKMSARRWSLSGDSADLPRPPVP